MMKKRLTFCVMAVMACASAFAQYVTAGDGTTYSLKTLSQHADTQLIVHQPGELSSRLTYEMPQSITISEGDTFVMDDDVCLLFAPNTMLTIEGNADFRVQHESRIEVAESNEPAGSGVCIKSATAVEFEGCYFTRAGLELMGTGGVHLTSCGFTQHDGSSAAAIYFITAGAESTIEHCTFGGCRKAAIGSAANASQSLTIDNCTFYCNSTDNKNIPQINVTAASQLTISNCNLLGSPEHNMVGGIGISNFMGFEANVTVSGCTITDNRYGIGTVGPIGHVRIENNTLMNNRYETNPMNGGSGISLYDPYQQTEAVVSGNHIEGSLWGVTIIGCKDVNLGQPDNADIDSPGGNVFKDNGFDGQLYDLYNNSTLTVYAQNNTWNVAEQTPAEIEKVVFHKADDDQLGEVIYCPAMTAGDTGLRQWSVDDGLETMDRATVYDLQGRQIVGSSARKKIAIVNGKKVVY